MDAFLRRHKRGATGNSLSNAGNLRHNAKNLHPDEFGAKLIHWAMDQTGTTAETGRRGRAGAARPRPGPQVPLVVFDGCRTSDYEKALRKTRASTPARGTSSGPRARSAQGRGRGVHGVPRRPRRRSSPPEQVVKDMNEQMKAHEQGYSGGPFDGGGFADNPSRLAPATASRSRALAGDRRCPGRARATRRPCPPWWRRTTTGSRPPRRAARRHRRLGGGAEARRLAGVRGPRGAPSGGPPDVTCPPSRAPRRARAAVADPDPAVADAARRRCAGQRRTPTGTPRSSGWRGRRIPRCAKPPMALGGDGTFETP